MKNSIVKKIAAILCCVLLAGIVPKGAYANELCINKVYLLGNDREEAFLDDTIVVEFNDIPNESIVSDAVITVSENGETIDYSDYEISLYLKVMHIKMHNLKKGSYYNFCISNVSIKPVNFTFKTVGFDVFAHKIEVNGNKVSAVVKSGYAKERTISFLTGLYNSENRLIGCFLNTVPTNSKKGQAISFNINYSGKYDYARVFALRDTANITPTDNTETVNRLKPVYCQDFNSTAVTKKTLSDNIVSK